MFYPWVYKMMEKVTETFRLQIKAVKWQNASNKRRYKTGYNIYNIWIQSRLHCVAYCSFSFQRLAQVTSTFILHHLTLVSRMYHLYCDSTCLHPYVPLDSRLEDTRLIYFCLPLAHPSSKYKTGTWMNKRVFTKQCQLSSLKKKKQFRRPYVQIFVVQIDD